MLNEAIRRYGFWLSDALAGGKVRKFYLEMKNAPDRQQNTAVPLQKLLRHAAKTTQFYKPFRNFTDIRDFPVVRKNVIQEHYDRFVSAAFAGKKLHIMKTSGTAGGRFISLQNREKRKRVMAEYIYFNRRCGFQLGERFIYSRLWFPEHQKSKLVRFAQNMLPVECSSLSDPALEDLAVLLQKDHSIKVLIGYASSLAAMADYFDRRGLTPDRFNLRLIISGAERLNEADRARLKNIFNCPVVSRYANQENGLLAQQDLQCDTFILNKAHYHFEFLQLDRDEPAQAGRAARLILTDLYNLAIPFIRYDTGDVVIVEPAKTGSAKDTVLADVSGRLAEILYDTRGNKLSPHLVEVRFRSFPGIRQYQLIQNSQNHYTVNLVGKRGTDDDADIHGFLRDMFGKDALTDVVYVDEIRRLASGKIKKTICNWKRI